MGEIERIHHIQPAYGALQRVGDRPRENRKQHSHKDELELTSTSDEPIEEVPQSNVPVEELESHLDIEA